MATITPTFTKIRGPSGGIDAVVVMWAGFAASGDVGVPIQRPDLGDRSIQFTGSFTGSPQIVWEGSNDGINFAPLSTPAGTMISQTAAGGPIQVTEACAYSRPRLSAGSGGAAINAVMIMRRTLR